MKDQGKAVEQFLVYFQFQSLKALGYVWCLVSDETYVYTLIGDHNAPARRILSPELRC